ncbi:hypothetical protein [Paenibacillus silvae]|uniref:Uncharacterized protein n=1 Tax=Paenibacillus silvae TaxID=1325358 RepID=A0A2W6NNQ6_9BACL|nr:hypothetical protein [Paenibacillus silvae]PZT57487.1 hypothetical protein DN757_02195 [Paenibacillus silvae]
MDTIKFTSQFKLEISESGTDTLDGKFIICDFNPNDNDVALTRDTIDSWISTLINKPLVGKIVMTTNGADFSGHNMKIVEKENENGDKYQEVEFDTSAFGSFYKVEIETIDEVEYIVAYAKIWKRFSQACEVITNRLTSGDGIKTSWEIQSIESHYETVDGKQVKYIDKGNFIGHALLGSAIRPAYPSSGLLNVAATETDDELSNALVLDISEQIKKEENELPKNRVHVSALTTRDLHQKVYQVLNPKGWNSNPYYSIWEIYPEEHKILAYDIERESEDDYVVVNYSVAEDNVVVGDISETKLSKLIAEKTNVNINVDLNEAAKLIAEKEAANNQLSKSVSELTSQIESKTEALVEAGSKIESLENEVNELKPYKEKVEASEREQREAEIANKKEELKTLASTGNYISSEEIESSELIAELISNLDEKGIKALIAERMMQKLANETKTVDVSTSNNTKANILNDDEAIDHTKVMASFLKN